MKEPVAIAVVDDPFRTVRRTGDNPHAVPATDPSLGHLMNARSGGVAFGGEIVGQEKDVEFGAGAASRNGLRFDLQVMGVD